MEIRRLEEADAQALWDLRLESLVSDPAAFRETADEHRRRPVTDFVSYLRQDGDRNFVLGAFDAGRLCGMAGFLLEPSGECGRIWGMFVAPPSRGSGAGRALLVELLRSARTRGDLRRVRLHVTATQEAARALYRSQGFREVALDPRESGVIPGSIQMEMELIA